MMETPPPKLISIGGGNAGGVFDALARSYAASLEKEGIQVSVLNGRGGYENLQWLIEGKVDLALIPGGLAQENSLDLSDVRSLGTIDEEPLFIFYKKGLKINGIRDFLGKRINIALEAR